MPVTQEKKELHVGLDIPRHTAKQIHNWVRGQQWPEGTELEHPTEYHITLLYTTEGHDEHKDAWWLEHMDQAEVTFKGVTAFPSREKGGYAYVLLVESPEIDAKAAEMQGRAEWAGLPISKFEGGYQAHLTVAYGPSSRLTGVKPPDFQFDVGPSSVSPVRPKSSALEHNASEAPEPPYYRPSEGSKHCGNCKMYDDGLCWGFGDKEVDEDYVCNEWASETRRSAYDPNAEILDHLSLTNVAANLHYKFEEGGLDAQGATQYASRMLKLIGYPQDEITIQAALQAWQQMYPQDRLIDPATQSQAIEAPATVPTESYPTQSAWVVGKIKGSHKELSQTLTPEDVQTFKHPDEEDEESSTVPTQVNSPEDHWPEFGDQPEDKKRDVQFSNDWKTGKMAEVMDPQIVGQQGSMTAALHSGQLPGDEHLLGDVNITRENPNAGVNRSYMGTAGHRDTGAQTPVYIKPFEPKYYHSSANDLAHERAAYMVAHHLGVPMPPTVVQQIPHPEGLDRGQGIVPVYAQVQRDLGGTIAGRRYLPEHLAQDYPEATRNIHLLDSVIGNADRHFGNLVIGDDHNLYPIDHGLSFNPFTFSHLKEQYAQEPLNQDEIARLEKLRHLDLRPTGLTPGEQANFQNNVGGLLFERRFPNVPNTERAYTPQVSYSSAKLAHMGHIHITHNGEVIGTLFIGEDGFVHDDGSPAAINAADHTNHGHKREHGQKLLDAIVEHLDRSTLVHAHHCYEEGCNAKG